MSIQNLLITDRKKVREEWGKSEEDVSKDIAIIRNWMEDQPHLPEISSDNMIEFFLTTCKFSIEKTKQNLDMYYAIRDLMPEIYRDKHPCTSPDLDVVYKTGYYICLPKLTPELYRISVIKTKQTNDEKVDLHRANCHFLANVFEIRIHEDLAMGDIYIVDHEYTKFGTVANFTPLLLKKYAFIMQKVLSNRLKAIHFINFPGYMAKMLVVFKSFLSKKLQNRLIIHESVEDLITHIPEDFLPSDYGGKEKSLQELEEPWKQKFIEYKDRFDFLEIMKVKEELRPEKLQNDEILGYHGNFKKLDVD